MKYHPETNYSKAWEVFRWLPSPRRVSEHVTLRMLVATVVVTSWTSSSKSGSPPLWSEHFSEGLGVGDSWNSTPSESPVDASVSLKRTLGTFFGDSKKQSRYGFGDTSVLTFWGIGGMIFGHSPDVLMDERLICMVGILIYRILCLSLGCDSWHTTMLLI